MANLYVRKSGSDANNGSTPALAKLTIASAISASSDGDTIYVGAGIYYDNSITVSSSKALNIWGDVTGQYTGDAGEVICSGLTSSDAIQSQKYFLNYKPQASKKLDIRNIILENWLPDASGTNAIINVYATTGSPLFTMYDCKIKNIYWHDSQASSNEISAVKIWGNGTPLGDIDIQRNIIEDVNYIKFHSSSNYTCSAYGINIIGAYNVTLKNNVVKRILGGGSYYASGVALGINITFYNTISGTLTLQNNSVFNIFANGYDPHAYGIQVQHTSESAVANFSILNNDVENILSCGGISGGSKATGYGIRIYIQTAGGTQAMYNNNVFNRISVSGSDISVNNITSNSALAKGYHSIPCLEKNSRFSSYLKGAGYSTYPTTDINGNPRPAYGNTNADIGAQEDTVDTSQKETTIVDAGATSLKVHPCQYFKRTFQIPVTASTARTVKVKIRIDGTWPSGSRPKVSLSGQGMTLSQATKNSTTGSFEELTVSGTPTTSGIALLTIEAHATNTDAFMYVDTITLS